MAVTKDHRLAVVRLDSEEVTLVDSPFLFESVSSSADGYHLAALSQSGHVLQWGPHKGGGSLASAGLEHARVISELQGRNVVKVCAGCGNL